MSETNLRITQCPSIGLEEVEQSKLMSLDFFEALRLEELNHRRFTPFTSGYV